MASERGVFGGGAGGTVFGRAAQGAAEHSELGRTLRLGPQPIRGVQTAASCPRLPDRPCHAERAPLRAAIQPLVDHGHRSPPTAAHLSPAERSRLSQCFQRGTQSAADKPRLRHRDVRGLRARRSRQRRLPAEPAGALRRKHGGEEGGRPGGALVSAGAPGGLKKLAAKAQWREVIKQGVEIIKANPVDHGCLLAMADACGSWGSPTPSGSTSRRRSTRLPADPEVNRQCAGFWPTMASSIRPSPAGCGSRT